MKSVLEKKEIESANEKEISNVSEKKDFEPQSRHYGLAIEYYNKAKKYSRADKRKLLYDALTEIEQAIVEDGENKTYLGFRGTIETILKQL